MTLAEELAAVGLTIFVIVMALATLGFSFWLVWFLITRMEKYDREHS